MLHERDNDVWPFPLPAALPIRPWIKGAWVSAQAEESLQTSWGRAPPWQEHSREGEGDPSGLTELHPDTHMHTEQLHPQRSEPALPLGSCVPCTPHSRCCTPRLSNRAGSDTCLTGMPGVYAAHGYGKRSVLFTRVGLVKN